MSHRVLILHRQAERRRHLRRALASDGRFEVVGEVEAREAALERARASRPHGIVVDLGVSGVVGSPLLEELRAASPGVRIVVLDEFEDITPADRLRRLAALLADELDLGAPQPDSVNLPCDPSSVRTARSFARDFCRRTGCDEAEEAVLIIVSELVTNAVRHAGTGCLLALSQQRGLVHVEVTDAAPTAPMPRPSGDHEEGGRGMALVGALSAAWGIDALPAGKVVWADVPVLPEAIGLTG